MIALAFSLRSRASLTAPFMHYPPYSASYWESCIIQSRSIVLNHLSKLDHWSSVCNTHTLWRKDTSTDAGYAPTTTTAVHNRSKYPGVVPFRTGSPSSPIPTDELSLPQLISVQQSNNQQKTGLNQFRSGTWRRPRKHGCFIGNAQCRARIT